MLTTEDKMWMVATVRGEIRAAIDEFAFMVAQQFNKIENRIINLDDRVGGLEIRLGKLETRVGGLENRSGGLEKRIDGLEGHMDKRFDYIEDVMVTKDYLDQRLSQLKAKQLESDRKQNNKLTTLIQQLRQQQTLSTKEANKILGMEPFPQKLPELPKNKRR